MNKTFIYLFVGISLFHCLSCNKPSEEEALSVFKETFPIDTTWTTGTINLTSWEEPNNYKTFTGGGLNIVKPSDDVGANNATSSGGIIPEVWVGVKNYNYRYEIAPEAKKWVLSSDRTNANVQLFRLKSYAITSGDPIKKSPNNEDEAIVTITAYYEASTFYDDDVTSIKCRYKKENGNWKIEDVDEIKYALKHPDKFGCCL